MSYDGDQKNPDGSYPAPPPMASGGLVPDYTGSESIYSASTVPPPPPIPSSNPNDSSALPPRYSTITGYKPQPPAAPAAPAPTFAPPPIAEEEPAASSSNDAAVPVDGKAPKKSWGSRFSGWTSKIGSPGFLPQSLDKECDKAAAILKAFCKSGVYTDAPTQKTKSKALQTIPASVISRSVGLAIFTTLRAGYAVTGALGSGVLIARLPDGSWGPPSAISVLTVGGGFQFGIDIYDCVCVINTPEALAAFTSARVSMGGDMAVSAGPWGAGSAVEVGMGGGSGGSDKKQKQQKDKENATNGNATPGEEQPPVDAATSPDIKGKGKAKTGSSITKPVYSYVKSKGFYAGVQIDGTVIVERKDANTAFYGSPVRVQKILEGKIPEGTNWLAGAGVLHETLRAAEAGPGGAMRSASGSAAGSRTASPGPRAATPSSGTSAALHQPQVKGGAPPPEPPSYDAPPPAYVDDGQNRPEVGDHKNRY